jgi:hypothetical protein
MTASASLPCILCTVRWRAEHHEPVVGDRVAHLEHRAVAAPVHPQRGTDPHVLARRAGQRSPGEGEPVRELLRRRPAWRPYRSDLELLKQRPLSTPRQRHDRLKL